MGLGGPIPEIAMPMAMLYTREEASTLTQLIVCEGSPRLEGPHRQNGIHVTDAVETLPESSCDSTDCCW